MPKFIWPPHSWPAFIVGLILLTYWVKVLKLVRGFRKTAGHDANFIPPEKLGRILRIIWIPTVALWVFVPLVYSMIDLEYAWFWPTVFIPLIVQWIAVVIALAALAITWACWINMGKSWRMGINPGEKTELVFTGPFAYVRHPIYGLSQLLMLMTVVILPSLLMIVIALIHIFFMQWEVRREEFYLVGLHGDAYRNYQKNVGRFCPKSLRAFRRSS
ncbi:MAG TPA: isoprenylcysteine carboxylmethyltransferase family protein [Tepidisphaeraceae bacterium]|jgi:protein-S-isoprenylcysteine O-methyltransferase Ste14|nr:isoprenylcysteine carboxylmethyltransferase family protein [Tepidisphaeraceae bacterium]